MLEAVTARLTCSELLLPMATEHRGLMHSILCLSGSHLVAKLPNELFEQRHRHHFDCALNNLRTNAAMTQSIAGDEAAVIDDPTVAQVLVLCLKSICAGEVNGEYRPHLDAAKHLIRTQPSANPEFRSFLLEFFVYHDVSNSITSVDRPSILMTGDFQLPDFVQPEAGMFLGVADGLFMSLSKIRQLRDKVRARKDSGQRPIVDYELLADAAQIDQGLRQWECQQPPDSPRCTASFLYRQCAWLYLQRTINVSSRPNDQLYDGVAEGLLFLKDLPEDSSCMSILLMPLFLLGISAFAEEHQADIEKAFDNLQAYSNLGNIKHAKTVVQKIWDMMDAGDEDSWYFEKVQHDMVGLSLHTLSTFESKADVFRVWISLSRSNVYIHTHERFTHPSHGVHDNSKSTAFIQAWKHLSQMHIWRTSNDILGEAQSHSGTAL
jgi:hypothetical protein